MIIPDVKKTASLIIARMKPDGSDGSVGAIKPEAQMDDSMAGIHAAAEDLINAIGSKSASEVADALKNAFAQLDVDDGDAD